jgi:hypothetical protein
MESNRRSFFKGLASFVSGVVAAKVASYTPKKEESKVLVLKKPEPKEVVLVPSTLTITHDGEQYHPLVVKKTDADKMEFVNAKPGNPLTIEQYKATLRKANI